MFEFKYHWLHIPTKKTGINTQTYVSKLEFLTKLDEYNRVMSGIWQYWSA